MDSEDSLQTIPTAEEESFFEVEDPDFDDVLGGFKTNNPKGNRWQRPYIHTTPKMSRFKKTVQMILCLHGWESTTKTQPMTLLIFDVKLNCHSANFRFQSVRMWLAFDEDRKVNPPNAEKASPVAVGYAPFVTNETWDHVTEEVMDKEGYGGELGVEYIGAAKLNANKETQRSYTRKHFDRGSADPLVDEQQRLYGINWYMEQNQLTRYGVKPNFHLAVLLKRSHTKADNKPISFSGIFDMETEAGFMHDFEQGARRVFRFGKQEDEAIYFDGKTSQVSGPKGEQIGKRVDKMKLGELLQGDQLSKLSELDTGKPLEGLEPFKPTEA